MEKIKEVATTLACFVLAAIVVFLVIFIGLPLLAIFLLIDRLIGGQRR